MAFAPLASPVRPFTWLVRAGVIAGVLATLLWRAAPAAAQNTTVEVYDARDLAALFASPAPGQSVANDKPEGGGPSAVLWRRAPATTEAGLDKIANLFSNITAAAGATFIQLTPGVFAVTADRDVHPAIHSMLTQLRDLSRQRYELEVVLYPVATPSAPGIGTVVTPDPNTITSRTRTSALRRLAQPIEAITRTAYISHWMPVVADNAVGYDPTTSEVISGLQCTAMVGAGPDSDQAITLQLTGSLTKVTIEPGPTGTPTGKGAAPATPAGEAFTLGLPRVEERAIQVDIPLASATGAPANKLTAVAVLQGFEAGQSIVLAAGLREIK
jgi:hypothetical protein